MTTTSAAPSAAPAESPAPAAGPPRGLVARWVAVTAPGGRVRMEQRWAAPAPGPVRRVTLAT